MAIFGNGGTRKDFANEIDNSITTGTEGSDDFKLIGRFDVVHRLGDRKETDDLPL
jgi:hypothetical protein